MRPNDVDWWHVAWPTFLAWPPGDERGDWRELMDLYAQITAAGGAVALTEALPAHWQARPPPAGHIALSDPAARRVATALRELVASDRVTGGTRVAAVAVAPLQVQLVLRCPAAVLDQRVGRLKSRSATLLAFEPELGVGGAGTWGRGFWRVGLLDAVAVRMAAAFVRAANRTEPSAPTDAAPDVDFRAL